MVGSRAARVRPLDVGVRIEARVLGGFEVIAAGRHLTRSDWGRQAAERLVKLLLVTPGHALPREEAAELLRPDAAAEASGAYLRKAIHFANRAVAGTATLADGDGHVRLDGASLDLDLDRLRSAYQALAVRADGGGAMAGGDGEQATETILELGGVELLPDDLYEDWLAGPREQLRSDWQRLAIRAAREAAEQGRAEMAHDIADRLLARDPADEAAHRLVIGLLAAQGRHHAVRRQFDLCTRALREAFDAEPAPETVEAFRAAERAATMRASPVPPLPFLVARKAEVERVEALFDRVEAGALVALTIRGATGIGKTRLLQEVTHGARAAGWRIVPWQAVEASGASAYAPLRLAFADAATDAGIADWDEPARSGIATIAPETGITTGIPFGDRTALVDALVMALERLARPRPLLLTVDDLPWLDEATIEVLQRAIAGVPDARILIATTHRDDEPVPRPTQGFLEQVRRSGGVDLQLGPLAPGDVEALIVSHLGGSSVQPGLARVIFERCEGNPLFCLELVRAGRDGGTIRLSGDRWTAVEGHDGPSSEATDTVRRLVANRSASLTGAGLTLMATAAELGPEISFATLQAVLPDLDGGLVPALDAALSSGLLVERGAGYAFAHPLFRLAVRGGAGSARRAGTHLAIARSLVGVQGDASPSDLEHAARACADVMLAAEHALTAAELGAVEALPFAVALGFAAGERAARLFDPAATPILERSLGAWARQPADARMQVNATAAHVILANLRMNAGDDPAANAAFHAAISAARSPGELAEAYAAFSWLPYRHGDFEGCLAILEEALLRLPPDAVVARANVESSYGWTLGRLARIPESLEHLAAAVGRLEASEDRRGAMKALDELGMMLEMVRRSDEAIDRLERSLALALELHDPRGELVRIHLGMTLTRSGRPARARPHIMRGLELAHQMGDRYLESIGAWAGAEMEDALGDYAAAKAMRDRELTLLASMGGNPHNEAMAHAHLAHLARLTGDAATAGLEAAEARRLAAASPQAEYAARVERALAVASWSELETG